jgi:hypothetical protein
MIALGKPMCAAGVAWVMAFACASASAEPDCTAVKAELVKPRHGLGNVLAKLKAGQEVRIGYFGGSITQTDGWRVKTLKWFQDTYPQAKVSEINGAIGGTGSEFGVYRYGQHLLKFKPDLVFVEFAVNDNDAAPRSIWRSMEGIVRQTWKASPETDICFVYTFRTGSEKDYELGRCNQAASANDMIAEHDGIPSVNVALKTVQLAKEGKLVYMPKKDAAGKVVPVPEGVMLFSNDGVHPLEAGHAMYAETIAAAIKVMAGSSKPGSHAIPQPFIGGNYENAKMVPVKPSMLSAGWKKLDPAQGIGLNFNRYMPEIWESSRPGATLTIRFKGSALKLYNLMGPDGGTVRTTIDGKPGPKAELFDEFSTYHRAAWINVTDGLPDAEHTVTVEILNEQPNRQAVIAKEKTKPDFDPQKYDGTAVRVGWIMLVGDLVE